MSDLEALAKGMASQLGEKVKESAQRSWANLPDEYKDEVEAVLKDSAKLTMRALGGEDVDTEIAHTKAAMASWSFVGASVVRQAVKDALKEAAVFAGKVFVKLVV
ncbi:MAG: hypothetical protein ACE5D3_05505 [Candidatus Binatia bacterium]